MSTSYATMSSASHLSSSKKSAGPSAQQSSGQLTKRLGQELMEMMMSPRDGISAFPKSDESMLEWAGTLMGPKGTPYEGLVYRISIAFPADYPLVAPIVRFESPCYHPNTTLQGDICLDILKEEWSPSLSTATVLLSLQSLLGEPNNRSPLNIEAADLWDNQKAFKVQVLKHYVPLDR